MCLFDYSYNNLYHCYSIIYAMLLMHKMQQGSNICTFAYWAPHANRCHRCIPQVIDIATTFTGGGDAHSLYTSRWRVAIG